MRTMKKDPNFPIEEFQKLGLKAEPCIFRHRHYIDKYRIYTVYGQSKLSYFNYPWKDRFKDLPFIKPIFNGWHIRPFTLILSVTYGENKYICFKSIYDLYGTKLDTEYEWWAFPLHDVFKMFQDTTPNIHVLACLYNIDCRTDDQCGAVESLIDYLCSTLPEHHLVNYKLTNFIIGASMRAIRSKLKETRDNILCKYQEIPEDMYKRICADMIERFNNVNLQRIPAVHGFKIDYNSTSRYKIIPDCSYHHPRFRRLTYQDFCSKILSDIPLNKLQEQSYYYSNMYIVYLCDFLYGYNHKCWSSAEYL